MRSSELCAKRSSNTCLWVAKTSSESEGIAFVAVALNPNKAWFI